MILSKSIKNMSERDSAREKSKILNTTRKSSSSTNSKISNAGRRTGTARELVNRRNSPTCPKLKNNSFKKT